MTPVLAISFGELTLKGANRKSFEDNAIRKLLNALKPYPFSKLYREQGKVYIEGDEALFPHMIDAAK